MNRTKIHFQKKKRQPKTTNFNNFVGMWKDRDITQESIRKNAWK